MFACFFLFVCFLYLSTVRGEIQKLTGISKKKKKKKKKARTGFAQKFVIQILDPVVAPSLEPVRLGAQRPPKVLWREESASSPS